MKARTVDENDRWVEKEVLTEEEFLKEHPGLAKHKLFELIIDQSWSDAEREEMMGVIHDTQLDKAVVEHAFKSYIYDIRMIQRAIVEKDFKLISQEVNNLEERHKLLKKVLGL